ncbi:hypothetical protein JYT79_02300 [Cardiobacterium sp. AH-315-I02]|nr:hypothetical protein [Cardiobacterium sp. AH-315-I02]
MSKKQINYMTAIIVTVSILTLPGCVKLKSQTPEEIGQVWSDNHKWFIRAECLELHATIANVNACMEQNQVSPYYEYKDLLD